MRFPKALLVTCASAALTLAIAAPAFAAESVCTMATTDYLNLRSGEGMSNAVLAVMPPNTSVEVYGMSQDGWYHVNYNGTEGFCYYRWLDFEGDADGDVHDGKTTEMFATNPLNIREKPSTSARVLTAIEADEAVAVTAKNDGWFSVEYNGIKGYCYGKYLTFVKGGYTPDKQSTAGQNTMNELTASAALNVRAGASKNAPLLGTLKKGDSVKLLGTEDNGWVKIEYNGADGYCYGGYLK